MNFSIQSAIAPVKMLEPLPPSGQPGGAGLQFGAEISRALNEVKLSQAQAGQQIQAFLNGEQQDLHQVALATQKAELQFETMLEFRNKFLQAYQEMMRL